MTKIDDEELYTSRELATILKVSRRTLVTWRRAGKLRPIALTARCHRYRGSDVRAFLVAREGTP